MEKTTNKINIEETETPTLNTPNWDKFDKKFEWYQMILEPIIGIIIPLIPLIYFLWNFWFPWRAIIKQFGLNSCGISLFFFLWGAYIIFVESASGLVFIQEKICDFWIRGYFLRKNQLAHQEYLEWCKQEQSKEVS